MKKGWGNFGEFFHVRRKILFSHGGGIQGEIEPMRGKIEMNLGNGR